MKQALISLCAALLFLGLLTGCSGHAELTEQKLREDLAALPAITQQNINGQDEAFTVETVRILEQNEDGSAELLRCELVLIGKYYRVQAEALLRYIRSDADGWQLESCSDFTCAEVTPVAGVPEMEVCAAAWQDYPNAQLVSRQTDLRNLSDRVMFSVNEEGSYMNLKGSVTYCYSYDNGWLLTGQERDLTLELKPIYGLHLFQKVGLDTQHAWVLEFVSLSTSGSALVHLMHFDVQQNGTVRTWEEAFPVTLTQQGDGCFSFSCDGEQYLVYPNYIAYCDGDTEQVDQLVTRSSCEWLGTYFDNSIVDSRYSLEQSPGAPQQDAYLWRIEQTAYDETGEVLYRSQSTYNQNGDRTSQVLTYSGETSYYGAAYAYDEQGRILYIGFCGQAGEPITESYYTYEDGLLTQVLTYDSATDEIVEHVEYRYDEQDRLVQEVAITGDTETELLVNSYDTQGNLWRVQDYEQGLNFVNRYDEHGWLMEQRATYMNGAFYSWERFRYNEEGQVAGSESLDEQGAILEKTVHTYDAAGRETEIHTWDAAQNLRFEQYNTYVDTP